MAADNSEQPAPQPPMRKGEFIEWMARLGFAITQAQAPELLAGYQLLARMKERVRSDRGFGVEAPSLTLPRMRGWEGRGPIVSR